MVTFNSPPQNSGSSPTKASVSRGEKQQKVSRVRPMAIYAIYFQLFLGRVSITVKDGNTIRKCCERSQNVLKSEVVHVVCRLVKQPNLAKGVPNSPHRRWRYHWWQKSRSWVTWSSPQEGACQAGFFQGWEDLIFTKFFHQSFFKKNTADTSLVVLLSSKKMKAKIIKLYPWTDKIKQMTLEHKRGAFCKMVITILQCWMIFKFPFFVPLFQKNRSFKGICLKENASSSK